jgi:amino acid transporter
MSRSAEASGHDIFLRKTSGLVKAAGAFDVFVYNFGLISVGIAISLAHFNVPGNYPGASIPWAELLAAAFMAAIAWGFWCWSVAVPRSGGVYAYVSRAPKGLAWRLRARVGTRWTWYHDVEETGVFLR